MAPLTIYHIDAFAREPFSGNPAAVCLLERPVSAEWMQSVANEMNLSETAFVLPREDGFNLRWFTPMVEVDLCGHATLASAHALWEQGVLSSNEAARFHTRSGWLTAEQRNARIEMDFPADPVREEEPPEELLGALGTEVVFAGRSRYDWLAEIADPAALREMRPDFNRLAKLGGRGAIVTARSDLPDFDFISRFFAPAAGVNEDPVTGSAHCVLAPYWTERLNRNGLTGYQASFRGGTVYVEARGDRVTLGGHAVTVLECRMSG